MCAVLAIDMAGAADLMELYTRALESDPAFQSARLEHQIAEQIIKEARSGLLPQIAADASETKVYQNILDNNQFGFAFPGGTAESNHLHPVFFLEGRSDFFNTNYSISITQPIYRASAFNRIPQANAEARQAEAVFGAAEQELMSRITQTLLEYLAASDNLDFTAAEREAIWQQLQEAEERLGSGLATITDVHDARASYALAEAAEIDARDRLEERRLAIAEIIGEIPSELETLSESFPIAPPDVEDVDLWVERGLFQNLTIKARREAVTIAEREVKQQRATRIPSLDFVANQIRANTGGSTFGGGSDVRTRDFALRLSIPIYDGGRASALTASAGIRQNIAMQELELEKRRVEREIRAAFRGIMSSIVRVEALTKSVFSNEAAVSAKQEGLRSGVNTGKDVLDARRDLFFARRDLAQARYVYVLDSVRLKQSAGVLSAEDLRQINAYLQ
jgi:outer membrane protein